MLSASRLDVYGPAGPPNFNLTRKHLRGCASSRPRHVSRVATATDRDPGNAKNARQATEGFQVRGPADRRRGQGRIPGKERAHQLCFERSTSIEGWTSLKVAPLDMMVHRQRQPTMRETHLAVAWKSQRAVLQRGMNLNMVAKRSGMSCNEERTRGHTHTNVLTMIVGWNAHTACRDMNIQRNMSCARAGSTNAWLVHGVECSHALVA